jgi:hypothetical protein
MSLIEASKKGELDVCRTLLRQEEFLKTLDSRKDRYGMNALQWASSNGNLDIVEILLNAGANVNYPGRMYALQVAVLRGRVEVVALLLARGADPNRRNIADRTHASKDYPLIMACLHRNHPFGLKMVQHLLSNGATLDVQEAGLSVLLSAIEAGNEELILWLVENIDVAPFINKRKRDSTSPVLACVVKGLDVVVDALLARGAVFFEKSKIHDEWDHLEAALRVMITKNYIDNCSKVLQAIDLGIETSEPFRVEYQVPGGLFRRRSNSDLPDRRASLLLDCLGVAVSLDNLRMCEMFIKYLQRSIPTFSADGCSSNVSEFKLTSFMGNALRRGHIDLACMLASAGANPDTALLETGSPSVAVANDADTEIVVRKAYRGYLLWKRRRYFVLALAGSGLLRIPEGQSGVEELELNSAAAYLCNPAVYQNVIQFL